MRWRCGAAGQTVARARSYARTARPPREGLFGRGGLPGQGGLKQALHRGGMDGLGQMRVETGLSRLTLVLGQSIAGQGDEPKPLTVRRRPDALGHLVSVDAGKPDIDESHVGPQPQDQLDSGQAIGRLVNFVAIELEKHAKRFPRVGIVLDEGDPTRRSRCRRHLPRAPRGRCVERGNADGEDAPGPRPLAGRVHAPPVKLDQPLDQGQPDPEAAATTVQGPLALDEEVEDAREKLRTYSYAAVPHAQHRAPALVRDLEVNGAAGRSIPEGILHEIEHHLLDAGGISVDPYRLTRQHEGMVSRLAGRTQRIEGMVGRLVQVERTALEM